MPTKLVLDMGRLKRRHRAGESKAQKILDLQVLQDTEPYVPFAQGDLTHSGQRESDLGSGELTYGMPYAAAQYYTMPDKSRAAHPMAVMRWFEASKAVNKARWERVAKRAFGRGFK